MSAHKLFRLDDGVNEAIFTSDSLEEVRAYANQHGFSDPHDFIYVENYGCIRITPVLLPKESLQPGSNLWYAEDSIYRVNSNIVEVLEWDGVGWDALGFTLEFLLLLGAQEVSLDFLLTSKLLAEEPRRHIIAWLI